MLKILITGSSGFVGGALVARLAEMRTYRLRTAGRSEPRDAPNSTEHVMTGDFAADGNWVNAVEGIDTVIHAAARVHVLRESVADPLSEFRMANVTATMNLARQAVDAGVRRLIYISSIKVNGEGTAPGKPYTADDIPAPIDPYSLSKFEAELGLMQIAKETRLEVVVIRPVLVYGPGVKANFLSMMHWLNRGVPLPFGAIYNKRSLVALDNLVDLIITCIEHPAAANQIFLVSDNEDLSSTELLQRIAIALGRPLRLLPVPAGFLKTVAKLLGKSNIAQRLLESLQVDISKTTKMLGWVPPVSVDEALKATVEDFLSRHQH